MKINSFEANATQKTPSATNQDSKNSTVTTTQNVATVAIVPQMPLSSILKASPSRVFGVMKNISQNSYNSVTGLFRKDEGSSSLKRRAPDEDENTLETENKRLKISYTEEEWWKALRKNDLATINAIIDDDSSKKIDLNKRGNFGKTPLVWACYKNKTELVKILLKTGAVDVNKSDSQGATPLTVACYEDNLEIVKLLLERGDIDVDKNNCDGWTLFMSACQLNHLKIVKLLLERGDIDFNKSDQYGYTTLMRGCQYNRLDMVKILLENKKVDPNKSNNRGETAFSIAVQNGRHSIIKLLLEDF